MLCWCERAARALAVDIPPPRRFIVVTAAITLAGVFFHGQLATGLVNRGDEFLRIGQSARAQTYYARARLFDRSSFVAAERFVFAGILQKTRGALRDAVVVASEAIARHPDDWPLRCDRALALELLGEFRAARRDFEKLAERSNDPRYYEFAAQSARRSGDVATATRLFARVIALDPKFVAARRALISLKTRK